MTTLILTGTLFSGWRRYCEKHLAADSVDHALLDKISAQTQEIFQQEYPDVDELHWRPFMPQLSEEVMGGQQLTGIDHESGSFRIDTHACLMLDFWKNANINNRFLLFYSSPEFELSRYISRHSYDESAVENVINAWLIRTQAMLTFFMNNRELCLLVNIQDALVNNAMLRKLLRENFNTVLEPDSMHTKPKYDHSALIEYLATTLLNNRHQVAELYDDLRSTATNLGDGDTSIPSLELRSKRLIKAFISEASSLKQLKLDQKKFKKELTYKALQLDQLAEELELYFNTNREQEKITHSMKKYLENDPLLKIARQARQIQ